MNSYRERKCRDRRRVREGEKDRDRKRVREGESEIDRKRDIE